MRLKNTPQTFGVITMVFHWLLVPAILGLFAVGWWMVDLDYYSDWYQTAPHLHKSVGVLVVFAMLLRLVWRMSQVVPSAPKTHRAWEKSISKAMQWLFYLLVLSMFFSGFFITSAQGAGLDVFNWFTIPGIEINVDRLEDLSGDIHEYTAYTLIGCVGLHALAALKHHFIDRDKTLVRMFGKS